MRRSQRVVAACAVAAALALSVSGLALAHVVHQDGPYSVAMGWWQEPTYVGVQNAVQVIIKTTAGSPVADLASGDLHVVVSTAGKSTAALPLDPTLDPDTGLGRPGEYLAWLIPTLPGNYTFHLTGSIHGQPLDETYTSSDQTFNAVMDAGTAQFPVQLPSLTELSTLSDRLTTRVGGAANAAGAAQQAASTARSDASTALLVGAGLGGLGLLVALVALVVALRVARRSAPA